MVCAKTGFSGLVYRLGAWFGEEWAEECIGLVRFGVVATVSWLDLDLVLVLGAENGVKTVVGPGVKVVVSGAPDASLSSTTRPSFSSRRHGGG
jgi:hypothetical protein